METSNLFFYQRRLTTLLPRLKIENYQEDWNRQEVSFVIREPVDVCDTTIAQIKELLSARLLILTPINSSLKVVAYGSNFPLVH